MTYEYATEAFSVDISVEDYIARFRDEERILTMCRQCPNFGNSWGCPPFDFDAEELLRSYKYAHIVAIKVVPASNDIPLDDIQKLILPVRIKAERELLDMEQLYGGRAFAYIGKCLHCNDSACTRISKQPCRHPEKVRPSLEAFGFDVVMTLKELFGFELLWGKNGKLPEYIILVNALFHNDERLSVATEGETEKI